MGQQFGRYKQLQLQVRHELKTLDIISQTSLTPFSDFTWEEDAKAGCLIDSFEYSKSSTSGTFVNLVYR